MGASAHVDDLWMRLFVRSSSPDIVEVLERRTTRLVGRYSESDGVGLVLPDDRLHDDVSHQLVDATRAAVRKVLFNGTPDLKSPFSSLAKMGAFPHQDP